MGLYPRRLESTHVVAQQEQWVVYSSTTNHIESHFIFYSEEEAQRYCDFSYSEETRALTCDETDRAWERKLAAESAETPKGIERGAES